MSFSFWIKQALLRRTDLQTASKAARTPARLYCPGRVTLTAVSGMGPRRFVVLHPGSPLQRQSFSAASFGRKKFQRRSIVKSGTCVPVGRPPTWNSPFNLTGHFGKVERGALRFQRA